MNSPIKKTLVIVYDGLCNLCAHSMGYLISTKLACSLSFIPIQSEEGKKALSKAGLNDLDPQSFLVIDSNQYFYKSEAILLLMLYMPYGWPILSKTLGLLPKKLLDYLYSIVAENRYQWFGKRQSCFIPEQNEHQS